MRVRAAQTLVLLPDRGRFTAFNFLSRACFSCSIRVIEFVSLLTDWVEFEALPRLFPSFEPRSVGREAEKLLACTALLAEGGPLARLEEAVACQWDWPLPARLLHFSLIDAPYLDGEASASVQRERAASRPSPMLVSSHAGLGDVTALPDLTPGPFMDLVIARRSVRAFSSAPLPLPLLAECLFAGLGITGSVRGSLGELPLKTTPSGGARNPFEAYAVIRRIEGLAPGLYHYCGASHSLARIASNCVPSPAAMLAGQAWADEAAWIVLLVGCFERTMWKYADANAYRVVLIEAGHIMQNMLLAATAHGLAGCPTAALAHSLIREALRIEDVTRWPIYALALGRPLPSA